MSLSVESLRVVMGGQPVVDGVSLDLPRGAFAIIVGPNGAGKTSLLRALLSLVPSSGAVRLDGEDLLRMPARMRARRVAYLPQGHEAHWPLPARDIVALGRFPHGATDPTRLPPEDEAAVSEAMRITDTAGLADRPITALSGGERARIALARVFAAGAGLILADEPTASLDPRHQIDVMRALRGAAGSGGLVVAVTHDLGLAARFADRVLVMEAGRLAADASPARALSPEVLARVFRIEAFHASHLGQPVVVPWA